MLSETEKAQAKYEEALKSSPQNSRVLRQVAAFYMKINKPDLAEPLLKRIIAIQSPATLTDVCWARRNLAIVLKSRGDFDHFCQGMALIDENLQSEAASIEDEREESDFLIDDPRKEKIGEAIKAMEDVVKEAIGSFPCSLVQFAYCLPSPRLPWPGWRRRVFPYGGRR